MPPKDMVRLLHMIEAAEDNLPSYELSGEVEADESYFGGVRKGKRGRGAAGKVAVFGLLKRKGRFYTCIIRNAKTETLLPIIQEKVTPDIIVYTDSLRSYNALDVSEFYHRRINHSLLFGRGQKSHQRHRELLEPGEASPAQI